MRLDFHKMQAQGNDFVVLDARAGEVALGRAQLQRLAARRLGVGCDQVLVLARGGGGAYRVGIYNADGGAAGQCGNGMRCIASFLFEHGHAEAELELQLRGGRVVRCRRSGDGVLADMGLPEFDAAMIPMRTDTATAHPQGGYCLALEGTEWRFNAVSLGNPHAVVQVAETAGAPLAEFAEAAARSGLFPEGVNVGFMQVLSPRQVRLRVHERGVGETRACGSGACAAVVTGRYNGHLEERVAVDQPGGSVEVTWQGQGHPVWLGGPTEYVFTGTMEL